MSQIPSDEPHVKAILDKLTAGMPRSYTVCDGEGPVDPVSSVPYLVVYAEPGTMSGAPFRPNVDMSMVVSVRAMGLTAAQARAGTDRARDILLGSPLAVTGRAVTLTQDVTSCDRDDSLSTPLFWSLVVYKLRSTT